MARSSEKANAMLNKWLRIKSGLANQDQYDNRKPKHTSEVEDARTAEHWRSIAMKDIMGMISKIQNAGLGEFAIRDLNDEINRQIGMAKKWDERIIELGGPDFRSLTASVASAHGSELRVGGGYKYFGAAKFLPGVRELFEKQEEEEKSMGKYVTRAELARMINPGYYGFEEDGNEELLKAEGEWELAANKLCES